MNTKEVLIQAKALIADPKCWTKGAFARNSSGAATAAGEEDAVCFCALGAIDKVVLNNAGKHDSNWPSTDARNMLQIALYPMGTNPSGYNDRPGTSHSDIMALFDKAIAAQP